MVPAGLAKQPLRIFLVRHIITGNSLPSDPLAIEGAWISRDGESAAVRTYLCTRLRVRT